MESRASNYDLKTTYAKRSSILKVHGGVGGGTAVCTTKARIPYVVKHNDKQAEVELFEANVATGVGSGMPAVMGLPYLRDHDAVMVLRQSESFVALPGPEGYKVEWSSGTRVLPLATTSTNHLVIPTADFNDLLASEGKRDDSAFTTDNRRKRQQRPSSSTDTLPRLVDSSSSLDQME